MACDRDLPKACGLHQACQIVNVIGQAVAAAGRPVGLAVPAKVGSNDMKRRPQRSRQLIPAAGVIEPTMNQDQWRRRWVTPIREVKSKPLGPIIAPVGSVQCCVHGAYLKPSLSQVQRRVRATMSIQSSKGLHAALPLSVCRTPPHHRPAFRSNWRTIARKRKGYKSGTTASRQTWTSHRLFDHSSASAIIVGGTGHPTKSPLTSLTNRRGAEESMFR